MNYHCPTSSPRIADLFATASHEMHLRRRIAIRMRATFARFALLAAALLPMVSCGGEEKSTSMKAPMKKATIILTSGSSSWTATIEQNAAANAFLSMLPLTIAMSDVNGNEKYGRLPRSLPEVAESPGTVQAGDLMLWGDDGLVIFYKTFRTPYRYTRLGRLDDVSGLNTALGAGKTILIEQRTVTPVIPST